MSVKKEISSPSSIKTKDIETKNILNKKPFDEKTKETTKIKLSPNQPLLKDLAEETKDFVEDIIDDEDNSETCCFCRIFLKFCLRPFYRAWKLLPLCCKIIVTCGILLYFFMMITLFITTRYQEKKIGQQLVNQTNEDPMDVEYTWQDIEYNKSIPLREFKTNDDLVDHRFVNITQDACKNFYEYSCGRYNLGKQNEAVIFIHQENLVKKIWIEQGIIAGYNTICLINDEGCYTSLKFYKRCVKDKNKRYSPYILINKIIKKMNTYPTTFQKIRFLIENGITNFVHLTKEKLDNGTWVHYLRPGGVLSSEDPILLNLYGKEGLMSSQKQIFKVKDFISYTSSRWLTVFGRHARSRDILVIENFNYFDNLHDLIMNLPEEDVIERLKWFVRDSLSFIYGRSCLEMTKLFFPMTFCKLFKLMSLLNDEPNGDIISQNIFNEMKIRFNIDSNLRVGTCSSLLHSNDIGEQVYKVENAHGISKHIETSNSAFEWAHEFLFKKWYKYYDPYYLFFTYPRILDEKIDDPLDWYTQVNAFFDIFNNEIIISPGLIQYPIFHHNYNSPGEYSRFGYIIAHEIAHSFQDKVDLECLRRDLGNRWFNKRKYEVFADIIGLSESFRYFYLNENITDIDSCNFLLSFAQTFCSEDPRSGHYGIHGSPYHRVMLSLKFASKMVINEFNRCFGCKHVEICKELKNFT